MIIICGIGSYWVINGVIHFINPLFLFGTAFVFILALFLAKFYRFRVKDSSLDLLTYILKAYIPVAVTLTVIVGLWRGFNSPDTRWMFLYCTSSFVIIVASRVGFRFVKEAQPENK